MALGYFDETYLKIKTNKGDIFAKAIYEQDEQISILRRIHKLYDIDTQEPLEMIDNYILYTNLDKCFQYSDVIVSEDDEYEFIPYEISEIKEKDIKARENKAALEGISLTDEAYKMIKNGVSQKEAQENLKAIIKSQKDEIKKQQEEIKKQKEEELKRIQEEKEQYGWALTFYKVFGDLFEEEKRYR